MVGVSVRGPAPDGSGMFCLVSSTGVHRVLVPLLMCGTLFFTNPFTNPKPFFTKSAAALKQT